MTPMAAVRALRALSGAIRGVLGWGFWLAPSETRLVDQKPHLEPRNPNRGCPGFLLDADAYAIVGGPANFTFRE